MSLNKSFNFAERYRLQVRLETFNTFNTPVYGGPNTDPTSHATYSLDSSSSSKKMAA
jgi:hypothetical protein